MAERQLKHVTKGSPIFADDQNELIDGHNANREMRGDGIQINSHAHGRTFIGNRYDKLRRFELTTDFTFPDLETVTDEYLDADPTPYASAKELALQLASEDDEDASGDPVYSYTASDIVTTIYAPQQFHSALSRTGDGPSTGYAQGIPRFSTGERCLCLYNRQSNRWEVLSEAEKIWRFELTGSSDYVFNRGDSAQAYLVACNGSTLEVNDYVEITVYDSLDLFEGIFEASTGGTRGWCKWKADCGRWEILSGGGSGDGLKWAKASSDWQTGTPGFVSAKRSTIGGTILTNTTITIRLPGPSFDDPAVYNGDVIPYLDDADGVHVSQGQTSLPLDTIIPIHNESLTLPTGWVDCDGAALPLDKKVTRANAPAMDDGEVAMNIGDAAFDSNVGFKLHGATENNHSQGQAFDIIGGASAGTGDDAVDSAGDTLTTGAGEFAQHPGNDTDNRQKSLVTRWIYRYK